MSPLRIQLNSDSDPVVIAGGGGCACDAVLALQYAHRKINVMSRGLCSDLLEMRANKLFTWVQRTADENDIRSAQLVFAASDLAEENEHTRQLATRHERLFHDLTSGRGNFRLDTTCPTLMPRSNPWQTARVCLVGAGPGDPGLLTLDAEQALAGADVVLYDRLVGDDIIASIPPTTQKVFVGKRRNHHHVRQDELNAMIIRRARAGERVLRLKGGDPFLFGRGGEELLALTDAGIDTRVIPGITAGSGCSAYAGIPLTHRDYASSCQFLTAQDRNGQARYDWAALVRERHTMVIYMGVTALRDLCPLLIEHGMRPDMPAALIERGTLPEQRVMTGTVQTLPQLAGRYELRSPAVLIVGEVVALHERMGRPERNVTAAAMLAATD